MKEILKFRDSLQERLDSLEARLQVTKSEDSRLILIARHTELLRTIKQMEEDFKLN